MIQLRVRIRSSCFPALWVAGVFSSFRSKSLEVDGLRSFEVDVEVPKDHLRGSVIREDTEEHVQLLHKVG